MIRIFFFFFSLNLTSPYTPLTFAMAPGLALGRVQERERERKKEEKKKHAGNISIKRAYCPRVSFLLSASAPYKRVKRAWGLVVFPYKKPPNYKGEGTRTVAPLIAGNDKGEAGALRGSRVHSDVIGSGIIYDINCHIIDWLSAPVSLCRSFLAESASSAPVPADKLITAAQPPV